MITASIVLYKTKEPDIINILEAAENSIIQTVWVIDNSPTDALRCFVCSHSSKVEYIYGQGNIGYGAAHNIAINRAFEQGATYHVILNPDIKFKGGVIEELYSYMNNYSDVGLVMPKVLYPNGDLQMLCKLSPTPYDIFARRLLPKVMYKRRNYMYEMQFTGYDKIWNCPNLSGCFMFIRLHVLKQVGIFDDRFFMYFEDTDLVRRIHYVSKTIYYPYVSIIHNHAAEHRHNAKLLKISIRSAIQYFNKWGWFFDKVRRVYNKRALVNAD